MEIEWVWKKNFWISDIIIHILEALTYEIKKICIMYTFLFKHKSSGNIKESGKI